MEDSEEPIKELKRLFRVHRAYEHMNNGDIALAEDENCRDIDEEASRRRLLNVSKEDGKDGEM